MTAFDATGYFVRRTNADINSKIQGLHAASQEKINSLKQYHAQEEANAAQAELDNAGSVVSVLQDITGASKEGVLAHDGLIGAPINNAVAFGSGLAKLPGFISSGIYDLDAMYLNKDIPQEVKDARQRMLANTATPEDNALLAMPRGDVTQRAAPKDYTQELRKDFTTNLKQIMDMETSLDRAATLRNAFDLSSAVHTGDKVALTRDLKERAKDSIEGFSQGLDQFKNGQKLDGIQSMASGLLGAMSEIPGAAVNNKMGAVTFLAENAANMAASGLGRVPQAISNVGYGLDAFGQGTEDFRKKNGGAIPSNEELLKNAALAGTAVGAEYLGDKLMGITDLLSKGAKAIDPKSALKQALGILSNPVTRTAGATVKGGTGEFFTEGYQTFAENTIKNETTSLEQAFEGGAIGAIVGGGTATAAHLARELTGTTDGQLEKTKETKQQKADFSKLVETNNVDALLDPQAKTYDPEKAVSVLMSHAKLPDVTPEVKAANLTQAREIVQALERDYANKENLLDLASEPSEVELAKEELVTLKTQLSSTDPQIIDEVSALNQKIAFREQVVALSVDNRALKRLSGEVKRANEQLSTTKKLQEAFTDQLRTTVSTEDVATHINKVSRAMSVDNMPDMEDSRQSAQALVNIAMVSPSSISTDSVMDLVNNSNSALSTEQRDYFRQFSEARQAENKLMSLNKVSQAIFTGTKNDVGIIQYRKTIGQALEANDQRAAEKSLGDLVQFAQSHTQKQALATELFSKVRISGDKQVRKLKKGGWEVAPSGKPLNSLLVSSNGGFTIHPNSGEFVANMQTEVEALNAAVAEQQAAFALKFGQVSGTQTMSPANVSKNTAEINTSPTPVQKAAESVQVIPSTEKETNGPQTSETQQTEAQGQEPAGAVAAGSVDVVVTAEQTALEDFQAQATDRVLRLLAPEEKTKLTAVTDKLDSLFKDVLAKTAFYIQSGVKAPASAFHVAPVIGMQAYLFTKEHLRGETEERRLLYALAHELAHLKDQATGYESEIADAINRGGVVYDELQAMLQNPKDPFVKDMFGYILVNPKVGVNVPREIYAQLAAIYANDPQLLKDALPNGYAFIQDQFASVEQEADNQISSEPGTVTQEAGTNVEQASDTGTPESRLPGGTGEILWDAKQGLAALTAEPKSAPGKLYQDRNLLVDHFSQSVAGVTAASQRPLVMVKNFISTVSKTLDFSGFLKDYKATDKQEAALKLFVKAAAPTSRWSRTIQGLLIHGYYTKDGKYNEDKKNFYQNPFNWMISKDDKGVYSIEENTNTALVYAAFTTLLELADAPATNNDKTLNGILGRAEDAEVPDKAYEVLGTVGTRANLLRNSSGKTAVAALGLKTDKDAGQNLLPQLEGGMGGLVEAFLLKLGLLEETVVTAEQMNAVLVMTQQIDGKAETRQVKDNASHVFIKLARDLDTGEFTSAVQEILEGLKGSNNVLDKLMSVEAQLKYPSLTPIVSTQTTTKTGQQVPRLLTDTNNQNSSQANYAREDMWKLLNAVSPEVAGAMAGIEEVSDTKTQNTKRRSIKAKNDGLWRELNRYHDYVGDVLLATADKLKQPIYFDYSVWLQQRVGIATNVINPQTSKAHRALFYRKDWESTVALTNDDMLDNFMLRVGEGFGVKTDRNTVKASLDKITELMLDPVVVTAVQVLQKIQSTDDKPNEIEQANLLAAVKMGGENFHTLDALVALAHYQTALDTGTNSFVTHIQAEVDGVANGPILAHALFGAASAIPREGESQEQANGRALNVTLERGGIFTKASGQEAFNDWKADPLNHDLYEHTITRVIESITNAVSGNWKEANANAVFFFTGMLTKDDGNISSDGRNIIKGPVTEMVFGSSVAKSLDHMAELFIGKVYDVLEKSANGDEKYPAALVVDNLNKLLSSNKRLKPVQLNEAKLFNTKFFLDADETAAIKTAFGFVFDKPVTEAVETNFADFLDRRTTFTQAAEFTHGVYSTVYASMRQTLVDKLVADELAQPGTGIPSTYQGDVTNRVPLRDLSKNEERQLEKQLAKLFPVVQTLFSKESQQPKAGLRIGKTAQKVSNSRPYQTKVNQRQGANRSKASTVRGFETVQESPGVAMLPLLIHSLDSYISHSTQQGMALLNIHDAVIAGLGTIYEASAKMNQQTFHALLSYSPLQEMYQALENTVNGLSDVTLTDAAKADLQAYLTQFAVDNEMDSSTVLSSMLRVTKQAAAQADTLKLTAMKDWAYVNQYARENSSYAVTEADQAKIAEALAQVSSQVSATAERSATVITSSLNLPVRRVTPPVVVATADNLPAPTQTYSTLDLYSALSSNPVSTVFDTHLKDVLTNIVEKLHGAFGSFKASLMQDTDKTALEVMAEALTAGQMPLTFSLAGAGLKFNDQQMFVAEQVHATVLAALDSPDGRKTAVYTELSKLFRETRLRLKDSAWAKDPATSALYERIFNQVPSDTEGKSNYLAEFAALGLAHEEFNALLKVPTSFVAEVFADTTILGVLKRLFNKILETFNGKLTGTVAGQNADLKLKALVTRLVEIENKRERVLNAERNGVLKFIDARTNDVREGKYEIISKIVNSPKFMKNRNVFIAAASGVVATVADSQVGLFFRNIDKVRNKHFQGIQGMTMGFLGEMNGSKPVIQGLLRAVKHFEGQRKKIITMTNKFVLQGFDNQGKDLTDFDKRALTKVLLHTGAHTLLDHFDTDKLLTLLKDRKALNQEIKAFEGQLSGYTSEQQSFFVEQSRALAYWLVTGDATHEIMMKNANNIARGFMSGTEAKLTEAEVVTATKTLDALTSLYALAYSESNNLDSAVKSLTAEQVRTDGGNGVRLLLLSHKEMEQQAKERLFSGSEALMVKGYVPEIYNPHTDVKAANEMEGRDLEALGYVAGAAVNSDPSDPYKENKRLYTLRDGGAMPWLSGIFSFTGMNAKGSSHHGKQAHRTQQSLTQAKLAAIQKRAKTGNTGFAFDPTQVKERHMVPLMNGLGQAVNYQYMMRADTKDTLLERDNRFDSVMGALNGSIFDKENSSVHNAKAVDVFFQEFDAGYAKEPNAYLEVSATSTEPELREIYKMLPQATKDHIKKVWGKDAMLVRSSQLDIAFGYRKLSLSTVFDKSAEERNALEQAAVWWSEATLRTAGRVRGMSPDGADRYAKRAAVYVRRGENVWKALVTETKDIFVIKSGVTALANIMSNLTLLKLYGVGTVTGLKDMRVAWLGAQAYQQDTERLFTLESQLASKAMTTGLSDVKLEIAQLKDAIARNPVRGLIEAGLMPTIVEDVSAEEDLYAYKTEFVRKTEKYTNKLNKGVKAAGKQLYMAHDTQLYKGLSQLTQLSDFVARYALYQHLTTRKDNPIAQDVAIQEASDAFINYDVPMHRNFQYLDDMGIMMFTKYFMRVQRVIRGRFKYAPGKVAMLLLAQGYLDMFPTALDASILFKFGNNPFSWGALQFPGALDELVTTQAAVSIFK